MFTKFKTRFLIALSAVIAAMLILAGAFMLSPKTTAYAYVNGLHWKLDGGVLTLSDESFPGRPPYGDYNNWRSGEDYNSIMTVTVVGNPAAPPSMKDWFLGCQNLVAVELTGLDTSGVANMQAMFHSCYTLTSLDLSSFNTHDVSNMEGMFFYCSNLQSLDLSSFEIASGTNVAQIFDGCDNLTEIRTPQTIAEDVELPLPDTTSEWIYTDGETVETITGYITSAAQGKTLTRHVHDWKTEWEYAPEKHWHECMDCDEKGDEAEHSGGTATCTVKAVCSVCNQPYGEPLGHDYSDGKNCKNCGEEAELYWGFNSTTGVLTLSSYQTDVAPNLYVNVNSAWESRKSEITSVTVDTYAYGTTDMSIWFSGCTNLETVNLSNLDTSCVTSMLWMFGNCRSLTSLDLSGFNTANVKNMLAMFNGCSSLTSLDLSGFDMSEVEVIDGMLNGCTSLSAIQMPEVMGTAVLSLPDGTTRWQYTDGETVTVLTGLVTSAAQGKALTLHDTCIPAKAVIENEIRATCTMPSSYDSVVYCSACGDELSRTSTVIPATGHDYSDGKDCRNCGEEAGLFWGLDNGD